MKKRFTAGRLIQHFFQGVLVLAPIFFTGYAIYWLFTNLDNMIHENIPHIPRIPGIGFVITIVVVTIVGYLSSSFITGRLFDLFDHLLERTPVIKYLYSSIKDVFDAFIGEKRKFDHPVFVHIYSDIVWEIGFITQKDMSHLGLTDMVAVYVPMSYAISGKVYIVKEDQIRSMENISAGEAMKFAVSGGVTGIEG